MSQSHDRVRCLYSDMICILGLVARTTRGITGFTASLLPAWCQVEEHLPGTQVQAPGSQLGDRHGCARVGPGLGPPGQAEPVVLWLEELALVLHPLTLPGAAPPHLAHHVRGARALVEEERAEEQEEQEQPQAQAHGQGGGAH